MNPNFNRRQFIGLAICVAVNTALPGCKKKEPEWTVAKDDKLKPLAFEISEGKATPLSGSGWKRCDDYIHLQLSGSSIPDRKIAKVKQKKGTLIVYVDNGNSEVQSMDLVLKSVLLNRRGDASISEHRPSTLRSLLKRVDTQELDLFDDDFYI